MNTRRALRVGLRTDASVAIGTGHVKRCLALAVALRDVGAQTRLVSRQLGVDTANLAASVGIAHVALDPPSKPSSIADPVPHASWAEVDWRRDVDDTARALGDWHADWLVVDHYAFDARWHRAMAERLGVRIAVIDDLADRALDAALLIDHNVSRNHREKYRDRLPSSAALLGGPRFALLGPTYAHADPFQVRKEVRSIGIFMGGVDAAGLSSVALKACREDARFLGDVEVATTSANPRLAELKELAGHWPRTSVVVDQPDLHAFFSRHDLHLGAGGGATWERCCVGVPTLLLEAAGNQRAVIPEIVARGAAAALDPREVTSAPAVGRAIVALMNDPCQRQALSERAHSLVDGLGARRVALRIAADRLTVRAATSDDAGMMYRWRNDPVTRSASHDQAILGWTEHLDWLQRALDDTSRRLLVGHVGSIDVGVVRFDARGDEVVVSLYLDPNMHGLGLGRSLLLAGEADVRARLGTPLQFVASVRAENQTSQRLFSTCGYRFDGTLWRKNS